MPQIFGGCAVMKTKNRLFALTLAVVLLFCPGNVSADDGAAQSDESRRITTEYYSPDLTDPPTIDATETVAHAGMAEPEIPAKSAILMDVETGEILYEKEPHERLAPASITKIMSLLLVIEAIESGGLDTDTVLSASEHACSMGGSQIWLEPGETMTVDDLLKATVIGSANDATVVLGEAIAGSEEGFVAMMNERAGQLGMEDTCFKNATGLDAEGHLTCAYDIAVMSRELIKHDLIKKYSTVWMDSLRDGKSELVNTNKLVRFYEGCTGLKTGTTSGAGACLSATAERDGMELVAVCMGAANSADRFTGARKLLDYGFANWKSVSVTSDVSQFHPVNVKGGVLSTVDPVCGEEKSFLVKRNDAGKITQRVELADSLEAPVEKGRQIGQARIFCGDEEIGSLRITAGDSVEKMTFIKAVFYMFKGCFGAE